MTRVGVDARVLRPHDQVGLGVRRYTVRILEQLAAAGLADRLVLYGDFDERELDKNVVGRFAYRRLTEPTGRSVFWQQARLPLAVIRDRVGAFWAPSFTVPLAVTVPQAVTIHDISFALPGAAPGLATFRRLTRLSARRAAVVLTDSAFSCRQMVEFWGVPRSKIRTVHLAADPPPSGWEARADETLRRLEVRSPYVLHIGTMYSRRHVPTLLAAFERARRLRPDATLVVVGRNRTSPFEPIEEQIAAINARAAETVVRHIPFVEDADLAPLYGRATVFVYLSSLEGFGLPPLEAMMYGVPVLTTEGGSLAEVVSGAARIVDPRDTAGVQAGLEALLTNEPLRADLAARGIARGAEFSWKRCADETWSAVSSLCG